MPKIKKSKKKIFYWRCAFCRTLKISIIWYQNKAMTVLPANSRRVQLFLNKEHCPANVSSQLIFLRYILKCPSYAGGNGIGKIS